MMFQGQYYRCASKKLQTFVFSATITYTHPAPKKRDNMNNTKMTKDEKISKFFKLVNFCALLLVT